ncbi:archaeal proteasome endopeptidase complex subunit beta [Hyperthermus butylicus]|uniref:Proteasome subunit beta 1 n=1 Tax=Hyperthermus butylicus (strain DSM 5456 / JCM 9403 / PLM1-5) TaxID=415426 RepID=PSB1_HYPBU|nr:archaeal proteasome endopeptidase complex subunit beta [Hyperthermus butylicus]A2BN24.1 RecName: Full=Proteasome subunit beta 1; AltName: Full=20S proteasome beta subunit 1; AltName: Full=Proteasome core protein PsmB 1; Flags: Precursor [Hyperthermus butylicus DSM 5456]ABM81385.1 proteasome beta subunit [Hyperthermus butylicus DSM 5456]
MSYEYGTGATAVGIRGAGYVVLAAEKRVSYGGFIISKTARKVYKITDYLGLALAGLFADLQAISKILRAEIEYYNIVTGRRISVRAVARLLATILYSYKYYPFLSETLVGGLEADGTAKLYVMDPLGSLIEDDYAAIGSGAPIAIGILENGYSKDMSVDDAKKLAIAAVRAAIERDAMSGDGIDLLVIRREEDSIKAEEESITI